MISLSLTLALFACDNPEPASTVEPIDVEPTTEDTATTATTIDTATTTATTTTWDDAFRRVDDAPAGAMWGGADVAIADDGTILVSWVDARTSERQLYLVRSDDLGDTFGSSMMVPTEGNPVAQPWTQPTLDIVGTTVGITAMEWTPGPETRGFGYTADLSDLQFGPGIQVADNTIEVVHGGLDPNGELWLAWIDYPPFGATVYLANPGNNYTATPMIFDGLPGVACPCCPLALDWTAAGEAMLAWRHNVDDIRNIAFAKSSPGGYSLGNATIATSTDWFFIGCPANGPELTELSDGTIALVWSDSSSGKALVYLSTSSDSGVSWSPEKVVAPSMVDAQLNPVVHQGVGGDVYIGLESNGTMPVAISTDGGTTFADPVEYVTPDGALDWIAYANGAGMTVVVGQTEAGSVWFKRIE